MFDVFYTGPKPNLFAFERPASDLAEAGSLCRTEYFWFINGFNDYTGFDFTWRPAPWESTHTHVWHSQWQENGGTYLAPAGVTDHIWHWRRDDGDPYVPRMTPPDIFYMDFLNSESEQQFEELKILYPQVTSTRYVSDHLTVFKRIMNLATTEHVWIISSICDYAGFDVTWHPSQWQEEMIHCFPSDDQKRGDTFYIHVPTFKKQMVELELLDWFNVINYSVDQIVRRWDIPVVTHDNENLIETIQKTNFTNPYMLFTGLAYTKSTTPIGVFRSPCLWTEKDRKVYSLSTGNGTCAVPRDIKRYLKTQVYDYPHINDTMEDVYLNHPWDRILDVIYISNGEPDAEIYYQHLVDTIRRRVFQPVVKRVTNINGRMAAYKHAASLSETPWFFAVFAKLEVNTGFNWHWQPDAWQGPKHYIFYSKNPVNGLEYGHMGMIAYNKRLVLETTESDLDFTLSKPHEVVPRLSGTAHFNQDPWTTWRTAFREVVKLQRYNETKPTVESAYRLKRWTTVAVGKYAEWSLRGAQDAVEFYKSVDGNHDKLMLSYEWQWLKEYFSNKY